MPFAVGLPRSTLASDDYEKLKSVADQISPGLIFVENADPFKNAIAGAIPRDVVIACGARAVSSHRSVTWPELTATKATDAVATAHAKTGPDTVAKFLFTSGTTGSPKAAIQTQRMLCANQQQVLDCLAFMKSEPPVFVDWAPWNHTASGNKVFYMTIYNGGTYYE